MKTLTFLICIISILSLSAGTYSQKVDNYSTSYTSLYTGVIASSYGAVSKTTDAGLSWRYYFTGNLYTLYSVLMLDESNYIACGKSGRITKSTDGGYSWYPVPSGTMNTLLSLTKSGNSIFAAGLNGVVLKSTDDGDSWSVNSEFTGQSFKSIFFVDASVGYVVGNNAAIFRTIDGGETWEKVACEITDKNLNSIFMIDANTGVVAGDGGIMLYTTDGGSKWTAFKTLSIQANLMSVCVTTAGEIITCGENKTVLRSNDFGMTWTSGILPQSASKINFNDVHFVANLNESSVLTMVGCGGTILYSNDGGLNWYNSPIWITPGISNKKSNASLGQNFPNPFNPTTNISYSIPFDANVNVKVFDIAGKEIAGLVNTFQLSGSYNVQFNASNLASGIYFYKMIAVNGSNRIEATKKMILTK